MPKLTVVFNYPDTASQQEAKRLIDNGHAGKNVVGVVLFDAIDKSNSYEGSSSLVEALEYVTQEVLEDCFTVEDIHMAITLKIGELEKELEQPSNVIDITSRKH